MMYLRMRFFSIQPIWQHKSIGFLRIVISSLLIYHGLEVFNPEIMNEYISWDVFKGPASTVLVYTGKLSELLSGILLLIGLFTRIGSVLAMGTMTYITFYVGQGRFWYEDQHPFLFALFALLFLFMGPGAWSVDSIIFKRKESGKSDKSENSKG